MKKIISAYIDNQQCNHQPTYLIVGAGLSGILLAKMMLAQGKVPLIVDQGNSTGGVWTTFANQNSHVQVDPIAFTSSFDSKQYDPYTLTENIVTGISDMAADERLNNKFVFNTKVTGISSDDNGHLVTFQLSETETPQTKVFNNVFIRTGTLSRPNNVFYEGEDLFRQKHPIYQGIGNDINFVSDSFKDKRIVIFGMGAFAIENAKKAILSGAKKVTIVARQFKPVFPRMCMYEAGFSLACLENILSESKRNKYWERFFTIFETMYDFANLSDLKNQFLQDTQDGKMIDFRGGAVDDFFFLAHRFGYLKLEKGTPIFYEDGVVINDSKIPADLVIKCNGFKCDTSLLNDKPLNHVIFVENPSLTHNINADRLHDSFFLGPKAGIPLLPLVSYPILTEVIETVVLYFQDHPNEYETFKLQTNFLNTNRVGISAIKYESYVQFFWDILKSGNTRLVSEIFDLLQKRHQNYMDHFDPETAYRFNEENWIEYMGFFNENSPYPFDKLKNENRDLPWATSRYINPIYKMAATFGMTNSLWLLTFDWVQTQIVDRILPNR